MDKKKMIYNVVRAFVLCLLQLNSIACNTTNMRKHRWAVSDCAPHNYPASIYHGSLHYGENGGASVPDGKIISNGWGHTGTTYARATDKEVPHRLDIVWLSLRENKFYGGSFELPKAKMEALFEEGFLDITDKSKENVKRTFYEIVVGVGPGGVLGVWLTGIGHNIQVATFYGEETEVDFAQFNPDGIKDRNRFVNEITAGRVSPQELAKPIDFTSWEQNAKNYLWKPVIEGAIIQDVFFTELKYYNNDKQIYVKDDAYTIPLSRRTIPKIINFNWSRKSDQYRFKSKFIFDKEEMFRLFNELIPDSETQEGTLVFKYKSTGKEAAVFLKVGNQQRQLEKVVLKTFKSIH